MNHHPTAAELKGLVFGGLSAERSHAVIAHLLRGCGSCSLKLAPYLEGLSGHGKLPASPLPNLEVYDGALDRAFAAVQRLGLGVPTEKTPEQKKREALALLVSGGVEGLREAPADLQGLPLYEALLEGSWALRHEDPERMVQLARCAAELADGLSESELGTREVVDLRCRAWVELGNAYRVADELGPAEEALSRASHLLFGTRDELLGARFFDVLASNYAARRFFDLACTTLDLVAEIYQQHGDGHLAGRALISKGIYTGYQGKAEEAVRLIRQGLSAVDQQRDPGLVFSALQTQAWFLVDCGRFRDARLALWELRRRRLDTGGQVNDLKLRWLEGHIFVGLEQLDRAEQALGQVKRGFEEADLKFKAALVGLELGAVWLRQGRLDEAVAVVVESSDVFLSLRIRREVLASILLLRKAGEMHSLSFALLDKVITSLHKMERYPNAALQPASER